MKRMIMAVIAGLLVSLSTVAAQTYELVVLDAEPTTESGAYSINNHGFSVGYKKVGDNLKPYLWTPARGYLELDTPDASIPNGIAYSINDYYDVVGTFGWVGSLPYRISNGVGSFWYFDYGIGDFWPASTVGTRPSRARAINKNGDIAGGEGTGYVGYVKNYYDSGLDYNVPMGESYLFGLNEQGNTTGMHYSYYSRTYAPLYVRKEANGSRTTVSGETTFISYGSCGGFDINTNNQVVGATPGSGFYWEPDAGTHVLLGSGTQCYAINNFNCIVGMSNNIAYMWRKVGNAFVATDLNKLVTSVPGVVLQKAFDINDKGQIVGQCLNTNTSVQSAFMLTPATPSPRYLVRKTATEAELGLKLVEGHVYAMRYSENLKTWTSYPDLIEATVTTNITVTLTLEASGSQFLNILDLTPP